METIRQLTDQTNVGRQLSKQSAKQLANVDPAAIAQECIMLFESEFKMEQARITSTGAIRIDSEQYGQFYLKSELLRQLDWNEYQTMRKFLINYFSGR